MVRKEIKILNKYGLHTRPATALVTLVSKFKSDVFLEYNGVKVNAKSILGLLVLAVEPGAILIVEANGIDEQEAVDNLDRLAQQKFNLE